MLQVIIIWFILKAQLEIKWYVLKGLTGFDFHESVYMLDVFCKMMMSRRTRLSVKARHHERIDYWYIMEFLNYIVEYAEFDQ